MAAVSEVFGNVVEAVLNSWTALRLAVEHGTGGHQSKEVAWQLVNNIVELFDKNVSIGIEDVADYLIDFMGSEFQTICEDNSPDEVATVLWQFHQHCKEGNRELVNLELSKLPKCELWLSKPQPTQGRSSIQSDIVGDNNVDIVMETEDPEWTQVKSRRRKLNATVE